MQQNDINFYAQFIGKHSANATLRERTLTDALRHVESALLLLEHWEQVEGESVKNTCAKLRSVLTKASWEIIDEQ